MHHNSTKEQTTRQHSQPIKQANTKSHRTSQPRSGSPAPRLSQRTKPPTTAPDQQTNQRTLQTATASPTTNTKPTRAHQ